MSTNTLEKKSKTERLHEKLREMAREQGVKPIKKIEDLYRYSLGAGDESVDEFLTWVQQIRKSDKVLNKIG